jgi:hypothetical protein
MWMTMQGSITKFEHGMMHGSDLCHANVCI